MTRRQTAAAAIPILEARCETAAADHFIVAPPGLPDPAPRTRCPAPARNTPPRARDVIADFDARGRYHFTSSDLRSVLGVSGAAARQALSRLAAKGEITSPARYSEDIDLV